MTNRTATRRILSHRHFQISILFIIILMTLGSVGCGAASVQGKTSRQAPTTEQKLRQAVHQWIGTPHRMGGTRQDGIDCSGLVTVVYRDLFDIRLPRTTRQQVKYGVGVVQNQLKAGDLIFFRPPHKVRHVGIYLGKGEFFHASTRRGVIISRLDEKYWRNSYWTARRVL